MVKHNRPRKIMLSFEMELKVNLSFLESCAQRSATNKLALYPHHRQKPDRKVFTIFPKLPRELRDEIWNKSIIPRLVHFQPGGGMAPAVLFVNEESRKATCGHYLVCYVPLQRHGQRHGQYALFINFKMNNVTASKEVSPRLL